MVGCFWRRRSFRVEESLEVVQLGSEKCSELVELKQRSDQPLYRRWVMEAGLSILHARTAVDAWSQDKKVVARFLAICIYH
jgi:hypothetical protein